MQPATQKLISLLTGDSTLTGLLGATSLDTKIYPYHIDKLEAFPSIVYSIVTGDYYIYPVNKFKFVIQFIVSSTNSKNEVETIFQRLRYLLNYYQGYDPHINFVQMTLNSDYNDTSRVLYRKIGRFQVWGRDN